MKMKLKAISGIMLTVLFISMLTLAFNIQTVKASGTIYIRADGSIDPQDAPISTVDYVTYTLIGNITSDAYPFGIVVEKDSIVVDGARFTLQHTGVYASKGIYLYGRSNVTIKNMRIKAFAHGIWLSYSSGISISGNNITNNSYGIYLYSSPNNSIAGNNIRDNISGVLVDDSSNNTIHHNSFINNIEQAHIADDSISIWDNGYPSGGNFWSDYSGVDLNYDGLGDTPYVIDADNQDNYPLMGMFSSIPVSYQEEAYDVDVTCNSTISSFEFDHENRIIDFDVSGSDGTIGFCRIVIPRALIESPYTILVDGQEIPYTELPISNITHAFLYFTYSHSTHHIKIFTTPPPSPPVGGKATPINISTTKPEIQTPWMWLATIILPLLATVVYVKFKKKKQ